LLLLALADCARRGHLIADRLQIELYSARRSRSKIVVLRTSFSLAILLVEVSGQRSARSNLRKLHPDDCTGAHTQPTTTSVRDPQRIQCLMLTAPGSESVGEAHKVLFVNLVEDRHDCVLNDLILQGSDAQRTLPPSPFRYARSPGRLRSIRPPMDAAMQVRQLLIQVRPVLMPSHAIDTGGQPPASKRSSCPAAGWS